MMGRGREVHTAHSEHKYIFREGIVLDKVENELSFVNCNLKTPVLIDKKLKPNERVAIEFSTLESNYTFYLFYRI